MVYVIRLGVHRNILHSVFLPVRGLRARRLLSAHLGLQHLLVHALDRRDSDTLAGPVVVDREGPGRVSREHSNRRGPRLTINVQP
jgi:hypothetical protein